MSIDNDPFRLGRRAFLKSGTLVLTAAAVNPSSLFANEETPPLRIGLVTDLHYADKAPAGTRHYRETLAKLEEAAKQFEQDKPLFLVASGRCEKDKGCTGNVKIVIPDEKLGFKFLDLKAENRNEQ